jgi:hypothetical protein
MVSEDEAGHLIMANRLEVKMAKAQQTGGDKLVARIQKARGNSEKVVQALAAGVKRMLKSDGWANYLKWNASFHNYSWGNQILIYWQRPDASRIAGFRAWQDKHKRTVKKGEKGIGILCPCIIKDKKDPNKEILIGFRVGHVFDVSQTDGEDIPTVVRELSSKGPHVTAALRYLKAHAKSVGCKVSTGDMPGTANGYLRPDTGEIVLKKGLARAQQAKTLAHELAHWTLEHGRVDHDVTRSIAEVEAESTAYMVMQEFGIDSGGYSFGYLASWSRGNAAKILTVAERVSNASSTIMGAHRASASEDLKLKKVA